MTGETPNRPDKPGIAVIPALETFWTRLNALRFQFSHDFGPQGPELRNCRAWLRHNEQFMHPAFPTVVGPVQVRGYKPFATCHISFLKRRQSFKWLGCNSSHGPRRVLQKIPTS